MRLFNDALTQGKSRQVNGEELSFDGEVHRLRDELILATKPVFEDVRKVQSGEQGDMNVELLRLFAVRWFEWERAYLDNLETHAIYALQPLGKVLLALEPVIRSIRKQAIVPAPRHLVQMGLTLQCLTSFLNAVADLSSVVLSSLKRDMHHDVRLLVLADQIIHAHGRAGEDPLADVEDEVRVCDGLRLTPNVCFAATEDVKVCCCTRVTCKCVQCSRVHDSEQIKYAFQGLSVEGYAFRMLGSAPPRKAREQLTAVLDAVHLLVLFFRDLHGQLNFMSPQLDKNDELVGLLLFFEKSWKTARRIFLEPDNLV